ncbi:hypothetical protein CYMTET_44624 [Cymbomonas tetramitiformis]|uniref:Bacteriophage/plasmid primase P4 C-terminal domain-containing protein n=1 Tax=Cymbomonas tetramitiformis TaxID=36881 RepID=A0AAE0BZS5_9CHLO|nr:hypothetical protein CYMTET_44624 [Cymbomonas tetramitiformis]
MLSVMVADLERLINQMHVDKKYVQEDKLQEITSLLLRAVIEPCQHLDVGSYLFLIINRTYRYGYDESQGTYIMYRFDGARWTCYGAKENFECEAQEFLTEVLQDLYWRWKEHVRDAAGWQRWIALYCARMKVDVANTTKKEREAIRREVRRISSKLESIKTLYHQIAKEAGISQVIKSCEKKMKSGTVCRNNNMLTPEQFSRSLDEDDFLIGFNNGVYNLLENRFYGRYKIPMDYFVSMSVGYDYEVMSDEMTRTIQEVDDTVYTRIFPGEVDKAQAQAVVGSLLSIGNPMKKLILLLGEGDNGKSAFVSKLLKYTLGDYFGSMPVQVITERREAADGCNPSLCANRKKRCLALNEGDKRMRLNSGMTKTLTGNDEIQFRNLYRQPVSARFHATLLYLSNVAPELESGQALQNRSYPIDCVSKFEPGQMTDEPDKKTYRRISDTDFARRCQKWKMAHMHMAIQWWQTLYKNDFVLPPVPTVSRAKDLLNERSEDGLFKLWIEENYERIKNPPSRSEEVIQVSHIRIAYNAQLVDSELKFRSEAECKRAIRRCTEVVVKDQQRIGNRNVRNFVYARKYA